VVLNNVGALLTAQGRPKEARQHLEESLRLRRQLEDSYGIALGLGNLAELEFELGDLDAAQTLLDESLEIRQKLQDKSGISSALQLIAAIRRTRGDLDGAREAVSQSLEIEQELGDRRGIAAALEAFALLALAADLAGKSLRLLGAANHLREQIASPAAPYVRRRLAEAELQARGALGNAAEAAWLEGWRLSSVAAAAEAMQPPRSC
jgi:tetratricopeptide (TPR) repeat protein